MSMRETLMSFRSNASSRKQKYFPQESPKKPRQKMPTIYKHKFFDKPHLYNPGYNNFNDNPELGLQKTSPLRKTRLDSYVEQQRGQMLMKTGRTSFDDPDWIKTTLHLYKRSNFSPPNKSSLMEQRNINPITNNLKPVHSFSTRRNEDTYFRSMIQDQMQTSMQLKTKRNFQFPMQSRMRSTLNWIEAHQRQVSPKVGALDTRDYSIRKPLLKIGKNQFVNTYSPFEKF